MTYQIFESEIKLLMKRGIIVSLLCFIFLFIHAPFAVQAEYIPEDAVAFGFAKKRKNKRR